MASTRKVFVLLGLVAALLRVPGCVDTLAQSKQLALEAASTQIVTLKTSATELARDASSAQDLVEKVQTGDLGIVLPSPLPPDEVLPGPTFTVVYGPGLNNGAVSYGAVVEATGESGGGGTFHQSSVFVCVKVTSGVGEAQKTSIAETRCRKDILELLLKLDNNTQVHLRDVSTRTAEG